MIDTADFKNLGWANNWKPYSNSPDNTPKEFKECKAQNHEWVTLTSNNRTCVSVYCCPICKLTWNVDSSD
jgi:hypothetical protein